MTESTDHPATLAGQSIEHAAAMMEIGDEAEAQVSASVAVAQATLALVAAQWTANAAQDRANELKRIEILAILAKTEQADIADAMDGPGGARPSILSGQAGAALFDWDGELKPSIARSLGLGGESDGDV